MALQFKAQLLPTLAAVAGVVATAYLGSWQLDRAAYKLELQQRLDLALTQPPVHLSAAPIRAEDLAFSRVEAEGELRPELSVFLDNRVRDGVVGYEVVTPLRLRGGQLHVLVDRGWIKAPATRSELPAVPTPAGAVRIEGIAVPPPHRFFELSDQTVSGSVWQNLHIERYRQTYHIDLQPVLIQQHNDLGDGLVRVRGRPDTGVNVHRAYALQWFTMSAVIAVIYVLLNVRRRNLRSTRFNLIAIAAVALLPFVGSYLLYWFWKPEGLVNYGELIAAPLPELQAEAALPQLKGKWTFLMVDSGACDDWCRRKLYIMRQVRLTQGKNMDRIERAWLLDDVAVPQPALLSEYAGTYLLQAPGSALLARLPATGSARDHIYLVDPLGNLVLRYPREADPSGIKKDLSRLLRASRIG